MRPRRRLTALAVLAPALFLAACATGTATETETGATDSGSSSDTNAATTQEAATELTVTVDQTGEGDTQTWTLTCDPVGGDHPDAQAACAAIATAGASVFDPVPVGTSCTMQYGGPQTAHVEGIVAGTPINADFKYSNGCEISRWDKLEALLGDAGDTEVR
jgi:hypothetical protein